MGLDQYAYKVKNQPNLPAVDAKFSEWSEDTQDLITFVPDTDIAEIAYFRKYHDLQGWMQNLYHEKGGIDPEFNCNKVELTLEDIDNLEEDIKLNRLPSTSGFFFGTDNTDAYKDPGIEFCENCRDAIKEGCRVFYDSWW
jgi:hypothetical protein